MFQRILVAYDGSQVADEALQEAIDLAKNQQAQLRIVGIVDLGALYRTPFTGINLGDLEQEIIQYTQAELDGAAAIARQEGINPQITLGRANGRRIRDAIIDEAKAWPADLIVLGTHGRGGIERMVLGSVAEGVARAAPVPVLLVRGSAAP